MEKIFVTGVDGFVGKYLVKDLIKKGYSVSGTAFSFTDKQDYKLLSSVATIKLIDLLDIILSVRVSYFLEQNVA